MTARRLGLSSLLFVGFMIGWAAQGAPSAVPAAEPAARQRFVALLTAGRPKTQAKTVSHVHPQNLKAFGRVIITAINP